MNPRKSSGTHCDRPFGRGDIPYAAIILLLCCLFFHEVILNPAKMLYYLRSDLCRFLVPKVTFIVESFSKEGVLPLWEPLVYSGKPPYGVPQLGVFYPFFLFVLFFSTTCSYGYLFAVHYVIAGLGMYFFVKEISGRKKQAFLSAIIFIFCGYMSARVLIGQYWHFCTISWIPFIFLLAERVVKRGSLTAGVLLGGALAMQFTAGHTQYFFYAGFILFFYLVFRLIGAGRSMGFKRCLRVVLLLIFSACLFFLLSGIQVLPAMEYSRYVYRANMYSEGLAAEGAVLPGEMLTMVFPNIMGSAVDFSYWGLFGFWEACAYMGLLPLALVVFSLFLCRNRYNTFFIFIMLFSLLFSMSKTVPVFPFLYNHVPGFNLFRCPSRMLALYGFSFAVVGGYGFSAVFDRRRTPCARRLVLFFCALFLILLSAIWAFAVFRDQAIDMGREIVAFVFNLDPEGLHTRSLAEWQGLVPEHYSKIREGLILPWQIANLVIALSVCAVLLYGRLKAGLFFILVCSASVMDLWSFGMPMVRVKSPEEVYRLEPAVEFILQDEGLFRVHDCAMAAPIEETETNGIFRIEGFESIFLRYYMEYLTCLKFDERRWLNLSKFDYETKNYLAVTDIDFDSIAGLEDNLNLLDLLSVKYVISSTPISRPGMELVYKGQRVAVDDNTLARTVVPVLIYRNENRLPRAFVVREAVVAGDVTESLSMLKTRDPRRFAVLSSPAGRMENAGEFREATITSYSPNRIEVRVDLYDPGFLILSEVWYPGWRAIDNGTDELQVLRVDHCLRGVYLEPGDHRIVFEYRPRSYIAGRFLSIIGLALFFVSLVLSLLSWGGRGADRDERLQETAG